MELFYSPETEVAGMERTKLRPFPSFAGHCIHSDCEGDLTLDNMILEVILGYANEQNHSLIDIL